MKRWGCSYAALVVALAAASPESPDQQVQETLRRQRLEEKFARWRRTPVARHHRPVLVATYSYLPPKPVEEVQTPSLQDDQWEKDYEAFETLQKAKGGQHPAMALLMRSQGGLEARVARVLQQTKEDQEDSATRQERLQREERQRFRQAKAMEADHHLAKMQAAKQKSAEVALMRVQGEAQQTAKAEARAREIMMQKEGAGAGSKQLATSAEQARFKEWQRSHESKSRQTIYATQKETVGLITKEVQKHRNLFDVVQELQKQQREQLKQQRLEEDTGRFERWQRTPQALAKREESAVQEPELVDEGQRFAQWKLQHRA
ncbi:unnamed protein product [Effrenium voratum]|nr:unnamed protein product [Effrenium voratum]